MTTPVTEILMRGEITVQARFVDSSNTTLLVSCALDDEEVQAVYKPTAGERPLWDFPGGLSRREVGAYLLSETLGWGLVPETVERVTGAPFGPGSLQHLVEEDGKSHYFTLRNDSKWESALEMVAAFDVVANNADRKSGHVLLANDRLWAIDHGLCFHAHPKLRTVIWDFAGKPLSPRVIDALTSLLDRGLPDRLANLFDGREQEGLMERTSSLIEAGHLPEPNDEWRCYPWPLV